MGPLPVWFGCGASKRQECLVSLISRSLALEAGRSAHLRNPLPWQWHQRVRQKLCDESVVMLFEALHADRTCPALLIRMPPAKSREPRSERSFRNLQVFGQLRCGERPPERGLGNLLQLTVSHRACSARRTRDRHAPSLRASVACRSLGGSAPPRAPAERSRFAGQVLPPSGHRRHASSPRALGLG